MPELAWLVSVLVICMMKIKIIFKRDKILLSNTHPLKMQRRRRTAQTTIKPAIDVFDCENFMMIDTICGW